MATPGAAIGIRARGVRRVFPGAVTALDGVDLDVAPGELVAVLGPSGCGKSTLLRLLAGLDRPDGGTLELEGAAEPGALACVFQDAHLLPWRSVVANVALPLELARVARPERLRRARAAVEEVGLADAALRYPAELSGGMRMRVSLARAVVTRPRLLLLDEPFAALDEITRQRLDDQLRALHADRAMTVVFVTHSIAEAAYLADRALVLSSRPARVVVEHTLDLPRERTSRLRAEARFARELGVLMQGLERSGA
ncbi:MAG: ABC transporter ATP-binding protein [Polyangiaceae bacterium]|nr:ABC transporter ATP-binding protein [Polyangiaceae bacterium]